MIWSIFASTVSTLRFIISTLLPTVPPLPSRSLKVAATFVGPKLSRSTQCRITHEAARLPGLYRFVPVVGPDQTCKAAHGSDVERHVYRVVAVTR
jgi:hypothetical protein